MSASTKHGSQNASRLRVLSVVALLLMFVLLSKLYLLQVVHGAAYSEKADRQYLQPSNGVFDRGTIFFTAKDGTQVAAATIQSGFLLAISPKLITDKEGTYQALNAIQPLDQTEYATKTSNPNDTYEELAHHLTQDQATAIEKLSLPGVTLYKENWRVYPNGSLASHALGFIAHTGDSGDTVAGQYGLERYYEDVLSRTDDGTSKNFFAEIFSDLGASDSSDANKGDIVTTIEPTVQNYLEKAIAQTRATWKTDLTGGIIINPQNGEIYAMALNPTFDPNTFNTEKNSGVFTDSLVEGVYEMGSIVKPLTLAAGLDSGVITASTTYDDTGFIELDGKKISNYDGKARGVIPMQQILNQSLNVGAAWVAKQMGNETMTKYFTAYGLGQETGIDLPHEAHGMIDNLQSPRMVEHATAAFGQGIAMTPIETARALSVLGNGGKLINPHIVKSVTNLLGYTTVLSYGNEQQVLKPETSRQITSMLTTVVDKALKNGTVMLPHWSIAAKTGTAQIANPAGGGYYTDRYLHSFFGYFPAENPKFLIFLYSVYPKGAEYASETLTDPFMDLAKFLIRYYEIPPDR